MENEKFSHTSDWKAKRTVLGSLRHTLPLSTYARRDIQAAAISIETHLCSNDTIRRCAMAHRVRLLGKPQFAISGT